MLDYTNCEIEKVAVHAVGNKTNGEDLRLSKSLLEISDEKIRSMFVKFFLSPFITPEFHAFTFTNGDFTMNPVYMFASQIFESAKSTHKQSINLAKHLYELSLHPQIKSGDLFIAHFSGLKLEGETIDMIGIFKSENRQEFLRLENDGHDFTVQYQDGINIEKLDKGCLILNTDKEGGYKVCILDRSNKASEAQFWKDSFLQLKTRNDDFQRTKTFLDVTRTYVAQQMTEDFEVTKTDQIDLLHRSAEYFKTHENFDKKEFEEEVLQDTGMIKSFRQFDRNYREERELESMDDFEISPQAVKKQMKVFKSVLKLDKNFHIYIHGNTDLIEQGVENDGRKFYKIYFKEEK